MLVCMSSLLFVFNNCSSNAFQTNSDEPNQKDLSIPPVPPASPPGQGQAISSDILVFGATPAGIMAGIEAQRLGRTVTIVEPTRWLGGMVAGGLSSTDSGTSGVISGLTLEYFKRTNAAEISAGAAPRNNFVLEPHVARHVFTQMLAEAGLHIITSTHVVKVNKSGTVIQSVLMDNGVLYKAKQYIDASYEGDLMAKAGISYTWGRESTAQYNEPDAGVKLPLAPLAGLNLDPYIIPGQASSGLLPYVSAEAPAAVGSADKNIMAYNYRMCTTDLATHGSNAIPYSQLKPANYDATKFIGTQRLISAMTKGNYKAQSVANFFFYPATNQSTGALIPYANGKFDINGLGMYGSDLVKIVNSYPDGDEATRDIVRQTVADYDMGLLYYLATDPNVPADVRAYINQFGACKDEFADNDHFPNQLYVREGRRMIGSYVMTEANVLLQKTVDDVIAMGGYSMDSHIRQYFAINGKLMHEGMADRTPYTKIGLDPGTPYAISYRALTPQRTEVTNLLNPVTLSASSMAYRSLRMEPQYMMMGAASGAAAALAISNQSAVQDVPYSQLRAILLTQNQIMLLKGDCLLGNLYVANGKSETAYLHASVAAGKTCPSQIRTCKNGNLSGSYAYSSCKVEP